jgi:hypothetical protein
MYLPYMFSFLVTCSSALVNLGFRSTDLSACIYYNIESFEQEFTFHNIFCFSIYLLPVFLLECCRCDVDPLKWVGFKFELEIIIAVCLFWRFV